MLKPINDLKNQIQPNRWSCLITAWAMVLGEPVLDLISELGHDGSKIMIQNVPEPLCRRGFFNPEILTKILLPRGLAYIHYHCGIQNNGLFEVDFGSCDLRGSGVVCGIDTRVNKGHAYARVDDVIKDPTTGLNFKRFSGHFQVKEYCRLIQLDKHLIV